MKNAQGKSVGHGGFYIPTVYKKEQKIVEDALEEAHIDYADLTQWSFPDEFMCFVMQCGLLDFVDARYPNPRKKNEVPIWFLITCQFLLHLHFTGKYSHLRYLLNAGSILTKFGFNVGSRHIGFNNKNRYDRKTAINSDTVRKFFKDTKAEDIQDWYIDDLQSWFKKNRAFDNKGIFILDQSHLVVPKNKKYEKAVNMPVDEHGQWYGNFNSLTKEQKESLAYHPCYALSALIHVSPGNNDHFHVAAYDLGAGNEDELEQAKRIIPKFWRAHPGVIKELIVDRGYVSGEWVSKLKKDYNIDTLVPLKKNMDIYQDAVNLAVMENNWELIERKKDDNGKTLSIIEAIIINDIELWKSSTCPISTIVTKNTTWDEERQKYKEHFWVLASTRQYDKPHIAVERYQLRVLIEERFKQFKRGWYISEFPSPHASLVESHVCFTLLTYSLLQLYLRRHELQKETHQMIATLRRGERLGKDAVLVYANHNYAVLALDDYTIRVAGMQERPRERLMSIMKAQKEARVKREA